MDELIREIFNYIRGMWKHRWAGLATAWGVGLVGTGVIMSMPNQYEATARIFVDTQSVLKPLMAGLAIQPDVNQQVGMLARTLLTRPNVEKVIRMSDLDLGVKGQKDKDQLVDTLMTSIKLVATRGDNLYNIAYRDSNPDKAKKVVQALVTMFVESGLGDKRKDTESARKFIEEQIKSYEQKLIEGENRLKEFKLKNLAIDEEFGKDSLTRLSEMGSQLREAKLQLHEAENSRDALKRQLESGEQELMVAQKGADPITDFSVPEIDGRLDSLRKNLDELLRRYTESHPDVIGTKRVIAQLEQEKRREVEKRKSAAPKSAAGVAAPMANPVTQQLKVSLAEAEANVASLRSRVGEYEGRLAKLRKRLELQPQIEAEFEQLNRDYGINKRNYDQLLSRRESASLSSELDTSATLADFRLIEPPRVAPKPVAPNRPLLLSGLFAIALAAGLGLTFVMSQIRPAFFDARALREVSGLPVLGSVSLLPNEAWVKQARRRAFAFLSGLAGLIAAYGGTLAFLWLTARG
ncbi:MAG: Wzz/FepE/Etk N-terminal domain-containing protein [Rhodocyclaceae bacterium]